MSYDMEFRGEYAVRPPLRAEHLAYLRAFNQSRHMKRDAAVTALLADPVRVAAGLPVGDEGDYFVGDAGNLGKDVGEGILDRNSPPDAQPGVLCHWTPGEDGAAIKWDGQRKFVDWEPWLCYLIEHFLGPWGYEVNGRAEWRGEEWLDVGVLRVRDNVVSVGAEYSELNF